MRTTDLMAGLLQPSVRKNFYSSSRGERLKRPTLSLSITRLVLILLHLLLDYALFSIFLGK